jgi:hypothetical protein
VIIDYREKRIETFLIQVLLLELTRIMSYIVKPGVRLTNQLNARIDRAKLRYMRSERKGLC